MNQHNMTTIGHQQVFKVVQHVQGVVEISFEPTNEQTISADTLLAFLTLADELMKRDDVRAIYYHSMNRVLPVDPDYASFIQSAQQSEVLLDKLEQIDLLLSKIRSSKKILIAVLLGDCLGNEFAWGLMAHYRIVIGWEGGLGFPETAFGLLPSFGSMTRMMNLWGKDFALRLATQAHLYTIVDALSLGLIDEQVKTEENMFTSIYSYLQDISGITREGHFARQENRVQLPPYRLNGHLPNTLACNELLKQFEAGTDTDVLIKQEHDFYIQAATSDQVIAMIRTNYYGIRAAKQQIKTIAENTSREIKQIGVIGAGMMGSGIAYEAARAGLEVTLLDTTIAKANHGKNYAQKITDRQIAQGKSTAFEQADLLQRIHTSEQLMDVNAVDVVIEAVFEDLSLKKTIIAEVSRDLEANTVFASNTTSLPIAQLAEASNKPSSFIGLHFFSPVERMPLVEVIIGRDTDEETKDTALKCIHLLGKTPIVVQDGPGFFTSRLFFNYLLEGITMVLEGISPSIVEKAARNAGFPVGPLLVLDEISLPLMLHVYDQLPSLHQAQKSAYAHLKNMIAKERSGRKAKAGFYNYGENGKRESVWEESEVSYLTDYDVNDLGKRLLHVVALDAFRCLSNGIISRPIDGDLGSVLGIGYAPHTGGVFSHIDQVGITAFVVDCERFGVHGGQWQMPSALRDLARQDYKFYDGFRGNWNPS